MFASADEIDLVASGETSMGAARSLVADGCPLVVLKLGRDGAAAVTAASEIHVDGVVVPEVDPVGAGDAFVASWLGAMLDGAGDVDRLQPAVLAGAFAVTVLGDFEGMPTRTDLAGWSSSTGAVVR